MSEKVLDTPEVLDALRAVVAEGGYVYVLRIVLSDVKACVYVRDGEPSCIVGRTLARLGVPIEVLTGMDHHNESGITDVHRYLVRHGWRLTPLALAVLAVAQLEQDEGQQWGIALAAAEQRARGG